MSLAYLNQFESKNTVATYKTALKKFFQAIYNIPEVNLEECVRKYFQEQRNYEEDVQLFTAAIKEAPPKSRMLYLSAIRVFLLENHIELSQLFWRRLRSRIKGSGAVSQEKVPNRQQLRNIFMHLPIHGKALFLTLFSSGMRIGEALQLKVNDVDLTQTPSIVYIRAEYTKSGEKRITFISKEAAEAIKEWLKVRSQYLQEAAGKSHLYKKSTEDQRLFPFTGANARAIWRNAVNKTGNGEVDPRTKRLMMHPHVLRKFFRAILGEVSQDKTEALMGHHGYLTEVYRKYPDPEKTLGEFYKNEEYRLHIFEDTESISTKLSDLEKEKSQLQQIVNGLVNENLELKSRISKTEEKLVELEKLIKDILEGK